MTAVVVDTSAAFAILTHETGGDQLIDAMGAFEQRLMSAAALVELGIVLLARFGPSGTGLVERFLREGEVAIVPVDREQADRALEGWRRFGKGRDPASLNLGDCFSYALAAASGCPVLCVGNDFAATDLDVIRPSVV